MRHFNFIKHLGYSAIVGSLFLFGCNPAGDSQSYTSESNDRLYLTQLKSSQDLEYYADLAEDYTFECNNGFHRASYSQKGKKNKDKNKKDKKDKKNKDKGNDHSPEHAGMCAVICHVPPGNPDKEITLIVGLKAVDAHMHHGPNDVSLDYLGPCGAQDDDDGNNDDGNNDDGDDNSGEDPDSENPDSGDGDGSQDPDAGNDPDAGDDNGSNEEEPTDDGSNEEPPVNEEEPTDDGSNEEPPVDDNTNEEDPMNEGSSTDSPNEEDPMTDPAPADPDL